MREIELTQGYKALVDDEDYDFVNQWKWCVLKSKCGKRIYAKRSQLGILMHVEIMKFRGLFVEGMDTDHENHNCLDNQKSNLRICSRTQNNGNRLKTAGSSKYKGVHKDKQTGLWRASIRDSQGKTVKSPRFLREENAAEWYNNKAKEYFGDFALLNNV